jgi:hypothetical protein
MIRIDGSRKRQNLPDKIMPFGMVMKLILIVEYVAQGVSHADGDGDGPALAVKRAKSNGDGDDIPRTSAR